MMERYSVTTDANYGITMHSKALLLMDIGKYDLALRILRKVDKVLSAFPENETLKCVRADIGVCEKQIASPE
jgi:hypothetical protein